MKALNICEISDIFQGRALHDHPFDGRGVSDLVRLGYRFGCLATYLPDMKNDKMLIAQMRGIVAEMLDIADKNVGAHVQIILPMARNNPLSAFVEQVVLKHFSDDAKARLRFMKGDYRIRYENRRGDKENILREGVRGIIPARRVLA